MGIRTLHRLANGVYGSLFLSRMSAYRLGIFMITLRCLNLGEFVDNAVAVVWTAAAVVWSAVAVEWAAAVIAIVRAAAVVAVVWAASVAVDGVWPAAAGLLTKLVPYSLHLGPILVIL